MTQTERDLYDFLHIAERAARMNGPAFRMFAEAVEATGKRVAQLTLIEVAEIYQESGKKYNEQWEAAQEILEKR